MGKVWKNHRTPECRRSIRPRPDQAEVGADIGRKGGIAGVKLTFATIVTPLIRGHSLCLSGYCLKCPSCGGRLAPPVSGGPRRAPEAVAWRPGNQEERGKAEKLGGQKNGSGDEPVGPAFVRNYSALNFSAFVPSGGDGIKAKKLRAKRLGGDKKMGGQKEGSGDEPEGSAAVPNFLAFNFSAFVASRGQTELGQKNCGGTERGKRGRNRGIRDLPESFCPYIFLPCFPLCAGRASWALRRRCQACNFFAMPATWWPWNFAWASSLAEGWRDPSAPAMVAAPQGEPPFTSLMSANSGHAYGKPT